MNNPTSRISFRSYGMTCSVEFDRSDLGIDEVYNAVVAVIMGAGFAKETWENYIIDVADDLRSQSLPEPPPNIFNK